MPTTTGCNHVAIVTSDLDRFVDFHVTVFEAEVVVELSEDGLRHALVDLGGGFMLHPFELDRPNYHARASSAVFDRGHIDHLALGVDDVETFERLRRRLVAVGASDGTVTDFGIVRSVSFTDPDGMSCEVAMTVPFARARTYEERVVEPLPHDLAAVG